MCWVRFYILLYVGITSLMFPIHTFADDPYCEFKGEGRVYPKSSLASAPLRFRLNIEVHESNEFLYEIRETKIYPSSFPGMTEETVVKTTWVKPRAAGVHATGQCDPAWQCIMEYQSRAKDRNSHGGYMITFYEPFAIRNTLYDSGNDVIVVEESFSITECHWDWL